MPAKTVQFLRPLLLTSAIAGAVLAILAPLGTDHYSLLRRFTYWIGLCLAGGLGAAAIEYAFSRGGKPLSPWPLALLQSLGASTAVSPFVFYLHHAPNALSIAATLFYIWVVAMTICAVGALQKAKRAGQDSGAAEANTPALISRLKPSLRRSEIYALEAQDHYVRVITSGGEDLILIRLSDAIAETVPLPGLSPHRSWWAAEAGVKETVRRNGKAVVILKTDTEIPVSRNRVKLLKDAAWL